MSISIENRGSAMERLYQAELAKIERKTKEENEKQEREGVEHLRDCRTPDCDRCCTWERLFPELVARVRAERSLVEQG